MGASQKLYDDYEKMLSQAIDSKNLDATCYAIQEIGPILNNVINSFKYTWADLNKRQKKEVFVILGVTKDEIVYGGDVLCIYRGKWTKVRTIGIVNVLTAITQVKEKQPTEKSVSTRHKWDKDICTVCGCLRREQVRKVGIIGGIMRGHKLTQYKLVDTDWVNNAPSCNP